MIAVFTSDTRLVSRLSHNPTAEQEANADLLVQSVPDRPDLMGVKSTSLFVVDGALEYHPTERQEAEQSGDVNALSDWMKGRVDRILKEKEVAPVEVGGVTYPADLASQSRVAAAIQEGESVEADGGTYEFDARDVEGTFHTLSLSDLKDLRGAYGAQVSQARDAAQQHKADIDAAETIDELNQIDVTTGWP